MPIITSLKMVAAEVRLEPRWRDALTVFGFCRAGFGAWTRRLPATLGDEFVQAVIEAYRVVLASIADHDQNRIAIRARSSVLVERIVR